jgi:anti-sigma factor RsiW
MSAPSVSCDVIEPELIAFHFGTLESGERRHVEAHLLTCATCLSSYFGLKGHFDVEPAELPIPSELSRARLRAAVKAELGVGRSLEARSWLWAAAAAGLLVLGSMGLTYGVGTEKLDARLVPLTLSQRGGGL